MPRRTGYCLAMNRDEKRARSVGLAPAQKNVGGHAVIYPSEPGGGTWISLNDRGVSLALINWYSVAQQVKGSTVSRGEVIPSVITASTENLVQACLDGLPLDRINPFRLISIFPGSRAVTEWGWDLKQLVRREHPWRPHQWVSSGFDELRAQQVRGRTFEKAESQESAGSIDWLRSLHQSHSPRKGPFSTCMHREDAVTVSYTEVGVLANRATMKHVLGAPCSSRQVSSLHLRVSQNLGE